MYIDFSNWEISDYAAWWGAIIATLMLIWNIIVALRKGPRIHIRATPNMQIIPADPITEDKLFISVTVVNKGTAPTTITHFCGYHIQNIWHYVLRKKQNFVINAHHSTGQTIPWVLKPGEQWSNLADQENVNENYKKGYLYIGIFHNQSKKPKYVRIKVN